MSYDFCDRCRLPEHEGECDPALVEKATRWKARVMADAAEEKAVLERARATYGDLVDTEIFMVPLSPDDIVARYFGLLEVAHAHLAALPSCNARYCGEVATKEDASGEHLPRCDAHSGMRGWNDLPTAATTRMFQTALRKAAGKDDDET